MPFFHATWSVASVFNRWGDDGWMEARDWRSKRRTEKTGDLTTEVVANVIRSLGYIVT